MDATVFQPADHIDARYGRTLRQVLAAGVEIMAFDAALTLQDIRLRRQLPCKVD